MTNRIFILLLFSSIVLSLQAQENKFRLFGKITDTTNTPIEDANIVVDGKSFGYSNADGTYEIDIAAGKHSLNIVYFGHQFQEKTIEIKRVEEQNFVLKPNTYNLSEVQIKGKTKVETLRQSAYSVNAIDVKNIATEFNNLNDIVGRSSGIHIREEGGVGSDFDLSINGLSGNAVRYFMNGVPLSSMGSQVNLANLPINLIERVEIYKGFVPAQIGTDALGGVINIITKDEIKNYLDASYGVGSFNTHKADFNAQYKDKKTGIVVRPSLGINYSDNNYTMKGVKVPDREAQDFYITDAKRFHDAYFSLLGQMAVGVVNKKWADSFFLTGTYSTIDKELQTGTTQEIVYGKAKRKNDSYKIGLDYSKKNLFTNNLAADLSLSYTWDHTQVIDTAYRKYQWDGSWQATSNNNEIRRREKSLRHEKRPLLVGRANFNYLLTDKHSLNLNYLLDHIHNDKYDDMSTEFEPSNDKVVKQIVGLSYSQRWWDDRLSNIFFVKDYIYHTKIEQQDFYWATGVNDQPRSSTKSNVGYGLGSRFHIIKNLSVKASYENAVRLPLAREVLGNGGEVFPNFKLKPEKSDNINLGLFGEIDLADKHSLYYETGAFYRKVEDYIRFNGTGGGTAGLSQYENLSSVLVKGIEGEIRYRYNDLLQLTVNGTYLSEKNRKKYLENGQISIIYNMKVPNKPNLYSNVELDIKKQNLFGIKDNQLKFKYHLQYIESYYHSWKDIGQNKLKSVIPTQVINNITLSYSLQNERYNVSLQCTNIFDRLVYDNLYLQKPGRAFFCKFRIFIN